LSTIVVVDYEENICLLIPSMTWVMLLSILYLDPILLKYCNVFKESVLLRLKQKNDYYVPACQATRRIYLGFLKFVS
jgi:hypothetical protein